MNRFYCTQLPSKAHATTLNEVNRVTVTRTKAPSTPIKDFTFTDK